MEHIRAALAGINSDLVESFELLHRAREAGIFVVRVELDHLIVSDSIGVRNYQTNLDLLAQACLIRSDVQIRIGEGGIAQSVSEGIKRPGSRFDIISLPAGMTASGLVIVANRQLADDLGKLIGSLPPGRDSPKRISATAAAPSSPGSQASKKFWIVAESVSGVWVIRSSIDGSL
jgi:hypothetical protein